SRSLCGGSDRVNVSRRRHIPVNARRRSGDARSAGPGARKSAPPDLRRGARRATAESAAELDVSRVRVAAGARRLAPAGVPVDPGPVDLAAVPAGRDGADVLVGVAAEALADRGHGLAVDAGGTDQARLGGGGGGAHG